MDSDDEFTIEVVEDVAANYPESVAIKTEPQYLEDFRYDGCVEIKEEFDIDFENNYVDYDRYVDLMQIKTEIEIKLEEDLLRRKEEVSSTVETDLTSEIPELEKTDSPISFNVNTEQVAKTPTTKTLQKNQTKTLQIVQPPLHKREYLNCGKNTSSKSSFIPQRRQPNSNTIVQFRHKNRRTLPFPNFNHKYRRNDYLTTYNSLCTRRKPYSNYDQNFYRHRNNYRNHKIYNKHDYPVFNSQCVPNWQSYSTILSVLEKLCQVNQNLAASLMPWNIRNNQGNCFGQVQMRPGVWAGDCKTNVQFTPELQIYSSILQAVTLLNSRVNIQNTQNFIACCNNVPLQNVFLNNFRSPMYE